VPIKGRRGGKKRSLEITKEDRHGDKGADGLPDLIRRADTNLLDAIELGPRVLQIGPSSDMTEGGKKIEPYSKK